MNADIVSSLNQHFSYAHQSLLPNFSWTQPGNHHITLKFLGHTPEDKLSRIIKAAESISHITHQFQCYIKEIHQFPNVKSRIIAAYVSKDTALEKLHARANSAMSEIGFHPEKQEFLPHITLGKSKAVLNQPFKKIALPETTFKVSVFYLYQSHVKSDSSEYNLLKRFNLLP